MLIIKKAKLVADEMMSFGGDGNISSITNAFGEPFSMKGLYEGKAFTIGFYNLPQEACIEILSQDWTNANVSAVGLIGANILTFLPPVSVDYAIKACELADNGRDSDDNYGLMLSFEASDHNYSTDVNETKNLLDNM